MKILYIILQICGLYVFYVMGSWIQHILRIPIPGSIIGMLLLFLFLLTGVIHRKWLEQGANFLLAYLPLIFLPSVIGVMKYGSFLEHKGIPLVILVAVNTVIIMAIGAFTSQWLFHRTSKKAGGNEK